MSCLRLSSCHVTTRSTRCIRVHVHNARSVQSRVCGRHVLKPPLSMRHVPHRRALRPRIRWRGWRIRTLRNIENLRVMQPRFTCLFCASSLCSLRALCDSGNSEDSAAAGQEFESGLREGAETRTPEVDVYLVHWPLAPLVNTGNLFGNGFC